MRKPSAILAALSLTVGLAAAVAAPDPAAGYVNYAKGTAGYCPDGNGVTVIIDFQELGGSDIVRCAPGDQETGHAALKNAGVNITGTNRWGEAFICRIENKPGPESEPCIDTPPASAYWSYWHAPNGGNWTYSQWGVMNRKPPLGSFEGWSFSKDKTEDTNPPPDLAPVRPTSGGSGDGGGSGGKNGGGSGSKGDSGGESGSSGGADGKGDKDSKSSTDSPSGATGESKPGPDDMPSEAAGWTGNGADGMQPASWSGIPVSTMVGAGVVLALAIAGGVVALRRNLRRAEETS